MLMSRDVIYVSVFAHTLLMQLLQVLEAVILAED